VSPSLRSGWKTAVSGKKTAQFGPGVDLDNEGKTSAMKQARKQARLSGGGNGKPAATKVTAWQHKTFCYLTIEAVRGKGSTVEQVLDALAGTLKLLQEDDESVCYGHLYDRTQEPLRKTPFPARDKDRRNYFKFHGRAWQFSDLADTSDRKLFATIMLYSDTAAEELITDNYVDLRQFLEMEVKAFQAVETVDNLCLLQAPNDIFPQSAADCLSELLEGSERKMILEKKQHSEMHRDTLVIWEGAKFPRIIARKLYPRGGPFVKKKRGQREDTLHKMAIIFEFEKVNFNCIIAALDFVKFHGLHKQYFGEFAVLTFPPDENVDKAERDRYRMMLEDHGRCTQGYSVSVVPGLIDASYEVEITITSGQRGEKQTLTDLCLHDLLRKIKVTMPNGKRCNLIQCVFRNRAGDYNIWFPGNNEIMCAKAEEVLRNCAAYILHQGTRWGMDSAGLNEMIVRSFNQYSARSAQQSKWDVRNQRVIAMNLDIEGEDSRNFRENFLGVIGEPTPGGPGASDAKVVVTARDRAGEVGNFDFDRDEASVNTIHTRAAAAKDDDTAATGFETVAHYDTSGHVFDADTVAGNSNEANDETEMNDDATGFESRSFCPAGAGMKTTGEDDDDMSEMTGFTNYGGKDAEAEGTGAAGAASSEMAWLAALGRSIGNDSDVKAEFLAFLQSRSSAAFGGDVLRTESASERAGRVMQGGAHGQQSGTHHAGPHVGVGEGSVGQPQCDPKGETGKGADDQRADDPG
jgi:hypothetical protein